MFSFASTTMFYVFGLFNSWSRLPIFGLSELEKSMIDPSTAVLNISVTRIIPQLIPEFINSVEDYQESSNLVKVSICEQLVHYFPEYSTKMDLEIDWIFYSVLNENDVFVFEDSNCSMIWRSPYQGEFKTTVSVKTPSDKEILIHGSSTFKITDYWIVAIGDSFASGEGNPDKNLVDDGVVEWVDEKCHRSKKSWTGHVFDKLRSFSKNTVTHFTFLACSGASVDNGILSSTTGLSQIDVIEKISKLRGKGPDLMFMSVGGNDVGYSEILGRLLFGNSRSLFNTLEMRLFYLSHELERLGQRIQDIKPNQVIIPYYFDFTRNSRGMIDSNCDDLKQISTANLKLAENKILKKVNQIISEKAKMFGWTVVDTVPAIFKFSGVCSDRSLIRNSKDSLRMQGDVTGALHPVDKGHQLIADLVWKKINFYSLLGV